MIYALDTNTCIDLLRGKSPLLIERLRGLSPAQVAIPSMVYGELLLGSALSSRPAENRNLIERLIEPMQMLAFDARAATAYASTRKVLQAKGMMIGPNDLVIASTVLANQALLISANLREYSRVPGLQVENWTC